MRYARERSPSSYGSLETLNSLSTLGSSDANERKYSAIKAGIRKSVPAAIVLWAFHKMPSRHGLTSRCVINFLKKHYKLANKPKNTGKSIGHILRCAVEFGLLEKSGNKYYLV